MTNKEEIIGRLALSVQNYKRADAAAAAKEALDAGIDPLEAINDGLLKGMTLVGDLFSKHKAFLPQLLTAAAAMYGALDILLPAIPKGKQQDQKKVTLAVVEGDVHDIGKNILKTLLTAGGYLVDDLGKDVPADVIADAAQENGAQVVALSALMTTTMFKMKELWAYWSRLFDDVDGAERALKKIRKTRDNGEYEAAVKWLAALCR